MRTMLRTAGLCAVLAAASLQAQSDLPAGTWRIAAAPVEMREPVARADVIVVALHDALRRELTGALAQGGPAFAINSCHIDVVGVIHRISRETGVVAGRTSDRLRNPANAPPAWARSLVAGKQGHAALDSGGFVVDRGGTVGVLRPIVQHRMCISCHGPIDRLDPAVRAALAARYPADRATGFFEGQIRGWFWVELPRVPAAPSPGK